jgi:hypothetical protein
MKDQIGFPFWSIFREVLKERSDRISILAETPQSDKRCPTLVLCTIIYVPAAAKVSTLFPSGPYTHCIGSSSRRYQLVLRPPPPRIATYHAVTKAARDQGSIKTSDSNVRFKHLFVLVGIACKDFAEKV